MNEAADSQLLHGLRIRQVTREDLISLEWDGEYTHYRRIFSDAFQASVRGSTVLWMAEKPEEGLLGQVFISLRSSRQDLADGSTRAYLYGFRVRPLYRNLGIGSCMMRVLEVDLVQRGFLVLTLNVARENIDALRFYKRMGFEILHADPGRWSYIDHRGRRRYVNEPAWRMEKLLSDE